jgi:hypothetical protein
MAQRFTKSQRQKLKQLILIADMHRYTEAETLQFIKGSLGYEISTRTLYDIKRENKQEAISWLSKMRGNKKYSYIAEFKRQIEKFEQYEATFFHLYDTTKSEFLKLRCIEKMSHMNIALVNMYNLLPQIAQNVPIELINNNKTYYYNDKDLSVY